ncbi:MULTISPECIES: hypothetical protein [unclassified Rhodanobacter]|uniref:hypothetical protein n=1 Tax=unclassified Rhodanobacter TaxID=2621553 RepID=UPI0007A9E336|nr:hypothetical protein [Rhodanobacter sp. FW510-R10]KZC32617.1 hypothetical protein RhoFW510R10_11930 [Rhodanobacter sp. FW510-R10]
MPTALARTLGVIAAAMVILSMMAPQAANTEITAWVALAALGILVATYPSAERTGARTDTKAKRPASAEALPPEARGSRARTAILSHLADRPEAGMSMVASFVNKGLPSSSDSARDLAPAYLAQRVRELTDGRAIELAELLGLDVARRRHGSPKAA